MVGAEMSTKLAALTLAELGLSARRRSTSCTSMPHARLLEAAQAAQRKLQPPGGRACRRLQRFVVTDRMGLAAVVDGVPAASPVRSGGAGDHGARADADRVDAQRVRATRSRPAGIEAITEQEVRARVKRDLRRPRRSKVIDAYRALHARRASRPTCTRRIIGGRRTGTTPSTQATRKAALNAAPAFLYWFTWQTPILDGRPRAFHCSELPFVFDNTDRCAAMTGGTDEARALAASGQRRLDRLRAHAATRTIPGLPAWPTFDPANGPGDGVRQHLRREERSRPGGAPGHHVGHVGPRSGGRSRRVQVEALDRGLSAAEGDRR